MITIDADTVHDICRWTTLADALHAAHRGPKPLVGRAILENQAEAEIHRYIVIPAWIPGDVIGSKLITVFPDNPARFDGVPAVQATYSLSDGNNGAPLCVIDGTALTYRKTAADSALGARLLARGDIETITMVGAGGLAPYLIQAHLAVRPSLKRVWIWNRRPERAEHLADRMRALGIDAKAQSDLELAVRQSGLVSVATNATDPLVKGDWLRPGTHLDLVGAYLEDMRESDDAAVVKSRLFVDSRWFAVDKTGELGSPLARGIIDAGQIEADLFELSAGYPVARQDDDITLFKNGGGAHLDLFTASFIWRTWQAQNHQPGMDEINEH